jgi:hypothetical protein
MNNVLIYAQGKGSRWSEGTKLSIPSEYKQLIPIGQELLIQRTVRQFNQHNVTVFAKCNKFSCLFPENVNVYELKEPAGSIIDGICTTKKHWMIEGTSLILLGDVVFDNKVVRDLSDFNGENITFFGRMSENMFTGKQAKEIFAIALPEKRKDDLFSLMVMFINTVGVERKHKKLWDLVRFITNSGETSYSFRDYSSTSYSDDIDSPDDWCAYGEMLVKLALEDDKNFVLAQEI